MNAAYCYVDDVPAARRRFDIGLPARPVSAGAARRALAFLDLPPRLLEDARLLVTELMTHCVNHSAPSSDDTIRVEVVSWGPVLRVNLNEQPHPSDQPHPAPDPADQDPWGLYIVDQVADRWGQDGNGGYWFELITAPA